MHSVGIPSGCLIYLITHMRVHRVLIALQKKTAAQTARN